MAPSPLSGVRILAVEHMIAMPFSTQILSDFGAEVIAVESVGHSGDVAVPWRLRTGRYKRRVQIKLNDPRGQELIRQIAKKVDVFGENFRPGVMDRYGLGYADLSKINARLIYTSVSGWGHKDFLESPYTTMAAYGIIGEAMSGSLHAIRRFGGQHSGIASGDITTALYTTIGILMALRHRDLTGKGQYLDMAMTDSLFAMAELPFMERVVAEDKEARGLSTAPQAPMSYPMGSFETSDGEFNFLILVDDHWKALAKLLGHEEWIANPDIVNPSTRKEAVQTLVMPVLTAWAKARTKQDVVQQFRDAGLAAAAIYGPKDIAADPHFTARRMISTVLQPDGREIRVVGSPIKLSAVEADKVADKPLCRLEQPGESTQEILRRELGMSDGDFAALLQDGVVGQATPA